MERLVPLVENIVSISSLIGIVSGVVSIILGAVAIILAHLYYSATKTSETETSSLLSEIRAKTDVLSRITDQHLGRLTDIIEKGMAPIQQSAPPKVEFSGKPGAPLLVDLSQEEERVLLKAKEMHSDNSEAQLRQLVRWGKEVSDWLKYERTYRIIFGSQIEVLNHLDLLGPQPMTKIKSFYDVAAGKHPEIYNDFSFAQWLKFMVDSELITIGEEKISITETGHRFLVYLKDNHISEHKPF